MAWDHTLARALPAGRGVVRLYRWIRPTLSFGRNEPAREAFDPDRVAARGVDVVRRPTGGRAVLHDQEVTYAVVAPIRSLGGARAVYRKVNQGLVEGLAELGASVALAGPGPALPPDAGPCFQEAAEGEVVAGARKLVGSAQVRVGTAVLQHGSILLGDGQGRIEALKRAGSETDPGPGGSDPVDAGGLRGLLGRDVTPGEVVAAVSAGLRRVLGGDWRPTRAGASLEETDLPSDPEPELLARYRSPEWSWRR